MPILTDALRDLSNFRAPRFGLWCGNDWSGGQNVTASVNPATLNQAVALILRPDGQTTPSEIDKLCRSHDIAYYYADQASNSALGKLSADIDFLSGLRSLNWSTLSTAETGYAVAALATFSAKVIVYDIVSADVGIAVDTARGIIRDIYRNLTPNPALRFMSYQDDSGVPYTMTTTSAGVIKVTDSTASATQTLTTSDDGIYTLSLSNLSTGITNDTIIGGRLSFDINFDSQPVATLPVVQITASRRINRILFSSNAGYGQFRRDADSVVQQQLAELMEAMGYRAGPDGTLQMTNSRPVHYRQAVGGEVPVVDTESVVFVNIGTPAQQDASNSSARQTYLARKTMAEPPVFISPWTALQAGIDLTMGALSSASIAPVDDETASSSHLQLASFLSQEITPKKRAVGL